MMVAGAEPSMNPCAISAVALALDFPIVSAYAFTIINHTVAYRVAVSSRAALLEALAIVRGTAGVVKAKKPLLLHWVVPLERANA